MPTGSTYYLKNSRRNYRALGFECLLSQDLRDPQDLLDVLSVLFSHPHPIHPSWCNLFLHRKPSLSDPCLEGWSLLCVLQAWALGSDELGLKSHFGLAAWPWARPLAVHVKILIFIYKMQVTGIYLAGLLRQLERDKLPSIALRCSSWSVSGVAIYDDLLMGIRMAS